MGMLKPFGSYLMGEVLADGEKSEGGIVIPAVASKPDYVRVKVCDVGCGSIPEQDYGDNKRRPIDIPVGAVVVVQRGYLNDIKWAGKDLVLFTENGVMAYEA